MMRTFILAGIAALGFLAIGMTVLAPAAMAATDGAKPLTCIDVGTC